MRTVQVEPGGLRSEDQRTGDLAQTGHPLKLVECEISCRLPQPRLRSQEFQSKTALGGRKRNASEFVCVCDMLGDFGVDDGDMRDRQHVTGRGQMPRLCAIDRGRKALHDPLSKIRREPA